MKKHFPNLIYQVIIVEQLPGKDFNRGKLNNVGFDVMKGQFDYFCFHDVDALPESESCDYSFCNSPTQVSMFASKHGYKLVLGEWSTVTNFMGEVTLFNKADFLAVNGYSNGYWGWGFEDDDLRERVYRKNMTIEKRFGEYYSLPHQSMMPKSGNFDEGIPKRNKDRYERMMAYLNDPSKDGLSTLDYQVIKDEPIFAKHRKVTVHI